MKSLFTLLAVVNVLLFAGSGILWFLLGTIGFGLGALALMWLEQIQDRVVRELSKTCTCPLCKANRGE